MSFFKKILMFFSFNIITFCNNEDYDDDDDYEEVEIIKKKKKINKKNKKENKKKSKKRSGIMHNIADRINCSINVKAVNSSYFAEKLFKDKLKDLGNLTNINNRNIKDYLSPSLTIGYKFNNISSINLRLGFANSLQTQINRYKYDVSLYGIFNFNLILSLRILLEAGIGYSFKKDKESRNLNFINGGNNIIKNISDLFNDKLDPLLFGCNIGLGLLFFSVNIGGQVSLSKLLSKRKDKLIDNKYLDFVNKYIDNKKISYLCDMVNIELRFYPLILLDYLIGWLI